MTERRKSDVNIPPEEFGPGCKFDPINNRLIGVSGTIYENVRIRRDDFDRLCDDLGIPRFPRKLH